MTKACFDLSDKSNKILKKTHGFLNKKLSYDIEIRLNNGNHLIQTIPKGTPISSDWKPISTPVPDSSTNVLLPPNVVFMFRKAGFQFVHMPILMSDVFFMKFGERKSKHLCIRIQGELPNDLTGENRLNMTINNNGNYLHVPSPKFYISRRVVPAKPEYKIEAFNIVPKEKNTFELNVKFRDFKVSHKDYQQPNFKGKVYYKDSMLLYFLVTNQCYKGYNYTIEYFPNPLLKKDLTLPDKRQLKYYYGTSLRTKIKIMDEFNFTQSLDITQKLSFKLYSFDNNGDPILFEPFVKVP